jgi:hypothetical protein
LKNSKDDHDKPGKNDKPSLNQEPIVEFTPEVNQALGHFIKKTWQFPEPSAALDAKVLEAFQTKYHPATKPGWKSLFQLKTLTRLFSWPTADQNFSMQYIAAITLIVTGLLGFMVFKIVTRSPQQQEFIATGHNGNINGNIKDPVIAPPSNNVDNKTIEPKSDPKIDTKNQQPDTATIKNPPDKLKLDPAKIDRKPGSNNRNNDDNQRAITNSLMLKGIKRVYVAPLSDQWQTSFRTEFLNGLTRINQWQIVDSLSEADAIFKINTASGNLIFITINGEIIWQGKLNQDSNEPAEAATRLLKDLAGKIE